MPPHSLSKIWVEEQYLGETAARLGGGGHAEPGHRLVERRAPENILPVGAQGFKDTSLLCIQFLAPPVPSA